MNALCSIRSLRNVSKLAKDGAVGAKSLDDFVSKLKPPRVVWLMVPAAAVDKTLHDLTAHMQQGDIIIDGGNSHYIDDIRGPMNSSPKVFTMSTPGQVAESGFLSAVLSYDRRRKEYRPAS